MTSKLVVADRFGLRCRHRDYGYGERYVRSNSLANLLFPLTTSLHQWAICVIAYFRCDLSSAASLGWYDDNSVIQKPRGKKQRWRSRILTRISS